MSQDPRIKEDQARRAREEFKRTVRVTQAGNGYIVKTPDNQFVYQNPEEMLASVKEFFSGPSKTTDNGR